MSSETSSLAVQAWVMQWRLDEAAFELGGDRYTWQQRDELADGLVRLAELLRSDDGAPLVIDAAED